VRDGYITRDASPEALTEVTGAVSRFEIFPGDPILESKLVRTEQGYLSAVLPSGMRGVSIAVTASSASGGFILPNDHVDVVLTRPSDSGQISETILRNVKVLAIGKRLGETGTTGEQEDPESPRTEVFSETAIATLELDPIQGETVINAGKIGDLSLALRSIADFKPNPNEIVQRPNSQAVRMIKFGAESSVMAGNNTGSVGSASQSPDALTSEMPPEQMVLDEPTDPTAPTGM
jgi:pilus assembly protein CpaB